ncbi:MAG: D-amino-acid transaminase [Nitrospinota bacterium]|nr:MAG: D-amino-acid transaminase [Nitrospinota bacterium]
MRRVIPMGQTATIPVLSSEEALARLKAAVHPKAQTYYAMYSSILGGIVTDPALMVLPMDDHMVHRGHAVFDTAAVVNGMVYQLDQHLDRFIRSAEMAKIPLPFSREQMREIILETIAASKQRKASVRYWLSAGPGGFGLSSSECVGSSFYVMIFAGLQYPDSYYTEGLRVITSTVPIKPPFFARVKSTNYLPNVLVVLEAKEKGVDSGIFIDERGMVGEGPNMNVAFVTKDQVLRHPKFDRILSGITAQRMLVLARRLVEQGLLKDVVVDDISVEEGKAAAEMLFFGSSIKVAPIVEWDGQPIGNGKPGPVAKALYELWLEDQQKGEGQLIPVPYRD